MAGGRIAAHLDALERDEPLHVGPVKWVELDPWHAGRVVLMP